MPENRLLKNAVPLLLFLSAVLAASAPAFASAQQRGAPQSCTQIETKQAAGRIFDGASALGASKGAQDAKTLRNGEAGAKPDGQSNDGARTDGQSDDGASARSGGRGSNAAGNPRPLPLQAKLGIGEAEDERPSLGSYSRLLERLEVAKLKTQIAKEEGALEKALQSRRQEGTQDVQRHIEAMEKRLGALEGAAAKAGNGASLQGAEPKHGRAKPCNAKPRAVPRIVSIQSDETGRFWAAAMNEKGKVVRIEKGSRWNGAKVESVGKDGVVFARPRSRSKL